MTVLLPAILHSISLTMGLILVTQTDFARVGPVGRDRYIIVGSAICVIALIYNFQFVGWQVTLAIVAPAVLMALGVAMLPRAARRIIRTVALFGFVFFFVATCVFWSALTS